MDFLKLFLRGASILPGVIHGVETVSGTLSGAEKKDAVLGIAKSAIRIVDAVEHKTIVDPEGFSAGLSAIVDGVVACLNASVWHKP